LADDLDRFLAGETPAAPPLTPVRRARRWARRNRRRLAGVAVATAVAVGLVVAGIALAPRPKPPPPPPDPWEEIRKELAAGRPVTLIGKKGLPRAHYWPVGATALTESPLDGSCEFETIQHSMLELVDDPGVDRYRVTASLRIQRSKLIPAGNQDPAAGASEAHHLGLYVGHSAHRASDGLPAHTFVAVTYNDYLSEQVRRVLVERHKRPPLAFAQAKAVLIPVRPNRPESHTASASRPRNYPPVDRLPGEWRRVGVEVTPAGVTYLWSDREEDAILPFDTAPPGRLDESFALVARTFAQQSPGITLTVPPWHPRMGVGIWCRGAAVSVRDVVIEPLP
jgi:hypothetical protein